MNTVLSMIPLSDILSRIGAKDVRTAQKWCDKNGVTILKCNKKKLIYDADFNRALKINYIEALKSKYPFNYQLIYEETLCDNYLAIFDLLNKKDNKKNNVIAYKPQGKMANDFLKDILAK